MTNIHVELLDEAATQALEADLVERLYAFNAKATGRADGRLLGGALRDEHDELIGGFSGHTWGGVGVITHLWVNEAHRGRGLGQALLREAEAEATRRQCRVVILATHDFQAPPFYEAEGYERIATIADWPIGHANHFYRKSLTTS